jgi:hypothetical protein
MDRRAMAGQSRRMVLTNTNETAKVSGLGFTLINLSDL